MAKKKPKTNIVEKFRDDGSLIYRLDRDKQRGEYHITPGSSQEKYLKQFKFEGFSTFPKALYPTGYGFKVSGGQLLKPLSEKYGKKLHLVLSATKPSGVNRTKTRVNVTVNADKLAQVNREVSDVKRARNKEIGSLVREFLLDQFPKEFTGTAAGTFKYRPNKIAELLEDQEVIDNLSANDKVAIQGIYPQLLDDMVFTLKAPTKVKIVADGIKKSKKVYLQKIIAEFETKLAVNGSEATWQKFLNDHILMLLNSYAHVIEHQSVELTGKFPDFMLIDAYGYLDVYEIKNRRQSCLVMTLAERTTIGVRSWHAQLLKLKSICRASNGIALSSRVNFRRIKSTPILFVRADSLSPENVPI